MLLDPFTVGAQIVNFLILVWLLRRVLYGPVTRAMHERERRIREDVDEARRLRAEADAERNALREQTAAFAAEQEARLAAARQQLEAWRDAQMAEARQEIDAQRKHWQSALAQEQRAVVRERRQRVGREILSLTRRALQDLADSDLETRVVARFTERLRTLPPVDRDRLTTAAREDGRRVHVRTAHALTDDDRARLSAAVGDALGLEVVTRFETAPDLGSGVELRAGGLKVAWSLHEYLASLEARLEAAFGDASAFDHERA